MAKILSLKTKTNLAVTPFPPFNFDTTVFKPSHYPDSLKIYQTGKYWFAMRYNNRVYGIKMKNEGTVDNPKIMITIFSESKLAKTEVERVIDELKFRFEFSRNISEFYKKFKNDKILVPFIKRCYGMHGSCAQSLYGLLMIGILLQNTVIRRSVQMTKDMLLKYGVKVKFDSKEVYEFWEPRDLKNVREEDLRKLKVGYRAKLFIKLSKTFVEEKILSRLLFNKQLVPTEKIIKYVKTRWGKWSALAILYIWEDIFWQRKEGKRINWLEKEIRL